MASDLYKVSVVIPTRNRKESLLTTLEALFKQSDAVFEVIVVDSSDIPLTPEALPQNTSFLNFSLLHSKASVCAQRNLGIQKATGDFIFLLDDDITITDNYIETILAFLKNKPSTIAVSGLVVEKNYKGVWEYNFPEISTLRLIWTWVFQLGIWTNLASLKKKSFVTFLLGPIISFYKHKDNTVSKAGWPMLTNFSEPHFRTQIYGLGASIIKREWLLNNLYDESLGQHGIGDNYGIAIKLLPHQGIFVLSGIYAYHHKNTSNRLAEREAYYKRVLALNYFSVKQQSASKAWLIWSLFGNLLSALIGLNFGLCYKNLKLIFVLFTNNNPLLK